MLFPLEKLLALCCVPLTTLAVFAARPATEPVSLEPVANRGFRDDVAGDGRGGWTDQGPDNDLATFRPGRLTVSNVTFDILDPTKHGGRAALVLGQASQQVAHDAGEAARPVGDDTTRVSGSRTSATLSLTGHTHRNLYLLHAAANPPASSAPIGVLIARYADGSETRHEVRHRRDIGNWRDPAPAENAELAWESENPTATIGLFLSGFRLEEKPLASLTFELAGNAAWMIVGLAGSTRDIAVGTKPQPLTIKPGADWAPYGHALDIAPGGVFDFSSLLHEPAGRYGAIRTTPRGHFEFEGRPGTRVRLWGVNLCFSAQYLEKAEADLLAERLARSGYNTVRFHHFDGELIRGGKRSWELNAQSLDKLDYLFAALKQRGIYLNIDLFTSRSFSEDELRRFSPLTGPGRRNFTALLPISEAAYDSWARFATALLSHRNPYTGLTWAEDPALIGICPVNENPLFNRIERDAEIFALYEKAFASAGGQGGAKTSNPQFNKFIHALNARTDQRMFAHLRSLGTKALLTGANYTISQGLTFVREHYDYIDCHSYWDHPKFPVRSWAAPFAFGQGSSVRARAKMPNRIMPTRIFGKPFVSTEFNFCRPNQFRFEGAVLMPAYASLQDWDALYNFQYAMNRQMAIHSGSENYFAIANDPIGLIADRVGSFLFQRGDIAPAERAIAYAVRPDEAFSSLGRLFPGDFSPLGLVARLGSLTGQPAEVAKKFPAHDRLAAIVTGEVPAGSPRHTYANGSAMAERMQHDGALPPNSVSADNTRYVSDTGQIELIADAGTVKVVTPRSELFILAPQSELRGERVTVSNGATRGSVSVIALASDTDEPTLAGARRILVTHLADALPAGMEFGHTDRKLLKAWGSGPHLLARADASLQLRLPGGDWKAWAVDATGARVRELPVRREGETCQLQLSTVSDAGTQLAYELAR